MASVSAATRRAVPVTVFSSIPSVVPSLKRAAPPDVPIVVVDDPALSIGGTSGFRPEQLTSQSLQLLQSAEILITEPAVLAAYLHHYGSGRGTSSSLWSPLSAAAASSEDKAITTKTTADDIRCAALPKLKWCQSTYAGVDPLFSARYDLLLPLPFTVTRFAGKFGPPMAEWCLGRILSHERRFDRSRDHQRTKTSWMDRACVSSYRNLSDLTLTILGGCGDIGKCIGRAAKQGFGMKIIAYTRSTTSIASTDESSSSSSSDCWDVCEIDLTRALQSADYIVSVLPSTAETRGLLSNGALECCCRQNEETGRTAPVFINVGRGDVISESCLIKALDTGCLSAAILDVFAEEPLPLTCPLWDRPDVVISPHVSAVTRGDDVPDVFFQNYHRYVAGKSLQFSVDWKKGY